MSAYPYLPVSPAVPNALNITAVSTTSPIIVVTDTTNEWVAGMIGKFNVPSSYGMYQLNGVSAKVLSVSDDNLTITFLVDGSQFDAFVVPAADPFTPEPATVTPSGSQNIYNFTKVPFRSLNGQVGN